MPIDTSNDGLLVAFTRYLQYERCASERTVAAYVADLTQFTQVLAHTRPGVTLFTAGTEDVAAFIHHLAEHEIGPRSRARKLAALRGFYDWLIKRERIEKDPTRLTVTPKPPKLLPHPLEPAVTRDMIGRLAMRASALDATPHEVRDLAIVETLYGAGLRVSELTGLNQDSLLLEGAPRVRVRGKGDKERIAPIGDAAAAAIRNYLRVARPQFHKSEQLAKHRSALFLSEQGTRLTRRRVHAIVAAAGGEAHAYPHRLRHSCATDMMASEEIGLRELQEFLGHASPATTQIYTQVANERLQLLHARSHPRARA